MCYYVGAIDFCSYYNVLFAFAIEFVAEKVAIPHEMAAASRAFVFSFQDDQLVAAVRIHC